MAADQHQWVIEEYSTASGGTPILMFLSGLDRRDKGEAFALLKLLAERGNMLRVPQSRPLGNGLFELRGDQVRIFYMFRPGRRITLLDGIIKK